MKRTRGRLLAGTMSAILIAIPLICAAESPSATGQLETVQGGPYRLKVRVFPGQRLSAHPAILRPGYSDKQGDVSDGIRGLTTGDNYNATHARPNCVWPLPAAADSLLTRNTLALSL